MSLMVTVCVTNIAVRFSFDANVDKAHIKMQANFPISVFLGSVQTTFAHICIKWHKACGL
jgi:hypothetical protein